MSEAAMSEAVMTDEVTRVLASDVPPAGHLSLHPAVLSPGAASTQILFSSLEQHSGVLGHAAWFETVA